MTRPVRVDIDLHAVQHNLRQLLSDAAVLDASCGSHTGIFVSAKDQAYGHGLITVAKALCKVSPNIGFALCSLDEALELVASGIRQPVLLLAGFFTSEELALIAQYRFQCVVHDHWQVAELVRKPLAHPLKVWLKVNTGMNRLGFSPDAMLSVYQQLSACPWVSDIVIMSHLACADQPEHAMNHQQVEHFVQQINTWPNRDFSLLNSAGVVNFYQNNPCFNRAEFCRSRRKAVHWLRPGLMIYGASPLIKSYPDNLGLKQAMTLKSRIITLYSAEAGQGVGYGMQYHMPKSGKLAVVAMGYGDGYPLVPAGTPVLVDGYRAQIVGRVSMDLLALDVSTIPKVHPGSEVIFWNQQLSMNHIAERLNVPPHMLMTGLNARVRRHYFYSG